MWVKHVKDIKISSQLAFEILEWNRLYHQFSMGLLWVTSFTLHCSIVNIKWWVTQLKVSSRNVKCSPYGRFKWDSRDSLLFFCFMWLNTWVFFYCWSEKTGDQKASSCALGTRYLLHFSWFSSISQMKQFIDFEMFANFLFSLKTNLQNYRKNKKNVLTQTCFWSAWATL